MYLQATPPTSWYNLLPSNGALDIFLRNKKPKQLEPITEKVKSSPIHYHLFLNISLSTFTHGNKY